MAEAKQQTAAATAAPTGADVSALSFEEALAELEQIVRGLESGQQKLEDAIGAYERGAALRRHCEAKLAEAEARVASIVERADGTLGLREDG
ncbi:MAG: exodeoxyribonuclease VII small subunit [Proteobacteria bacterium]|nr:exodeoxyribonuclease VII small subunit [Pseudomonadota bacterium]